MSSTISALRLAAVFPRSTGYMVSVVFAPALEQEAVERVTSCGCQSVDEDDEESVVLWFVTKLICEDCAFASLAFFFVMRVLTSS